MSAEVSGMILRCSKTGKLFFNEVDAKQHNEDTGFAEFEQVSPDDKVWYCLETGKVCQSETEKTIYQKRDKTAITFEEKTIAFLKERYLERKARAQAAAATAGSDEATPMEVDGAPAAAPDPPNISKETLDQLLEMGFPQPRAEKALVRTSNGPLESAITWLSDHAEDADIDVPLELTPTILAQADIDAAAAAKGANAHLTLEEKQAKLQAAIEAAQRKKAESEREEEKAREKARRESGKAMVKTKAELDELQRKRDREARKKEKEDDLRHRQYLREQLEQDKAERRAAREKAGLPPLASDAPKPAAAPPPAPTPAPAPAAPSQPAAEPRVHAPVAVPVVPVADALKVLLSNRDFMIDGYAEVAAKLADNINKQPAEVTAHRAARLRAAPPCYPPPLRLRAPAPLTRRRSARAGQVPQRQAE